jgi:hypothetical protein
MIEALALIGAPMIIGAVTGVLWYRFAPEPKQHTRIEPRFSSEDT